MSTVYISTEDTIQSMDVWRNQTEQEFDLTDVLTEDRLAVIFMGSLAPSSLSLKQFLPISLTETGDGYTASFVEANIHSSGETYWEAIDNLKTLIVDAFEMLQDIEQSALGPIPSKQLATLQSFIKSA